MDKLKEMWAALRAKLANLHKSMTVWFNGVMAFAAFGLPELLSQLPSVAAYLPSPTYGQVLLAAIVGNIVLRFKTKNALENK